MVPSQTGERQMDNMPMGNTAGMDRPAMNMPGMQSSSGGGMSMGAGTSMGTGMTHGSMSTDSMSTLMSAIYMRMMADPVIRERAMTDPMLRGMMARMSAEHSAAMSMNGQMPMSGMSGMSGMSDAMAMPAAKLTRKSARPTTTRSATKAAAKPAGKPAAKAAPKPMNAMPGMGNMPGMGKP